MKKRLSIAAKGSSRCRRSPFTKLPRSFSWAGRIGLFLTLIFTPAAIDACNCDSTKTIEAHIADANVIVLGTCNNIITNPIKGGLNVSFQVDSSWNRAIEFNATFHTKPSDQCGFDFQVGKRYLVFGKKRHQTVETSQCLPNTSMNEKGKTLLTRLGQGYPPGRKEMAMRMNLLLLGLGAGGLLLVGFVVLRKRIFRRKRQATF